MKHTKTLICFLAIIIAAIGIKMILRKTKIIEGHGGGGGHGGGHGAAGSHVGGHGAAGRRGGYYGGGYGGGYSSYPLYYGEYNDYYTSYDPYLVGRPIYPVIQQVPNYPYYY